MAQNVSPVPSAPVAAGITALRNGDRARARALLIAALQTTPADATAWLWLSGAVNDRAEQRYCLEHALAADPTLAPAQRGLTELAGVVARAPVEFEQSAVPSSQSAYPTPHASRPLLLAPRSTPEIIPSLAIWTQPRVALQVALAERSPWETGFLGALAGMYGVLAWAAQDNLGDQLRPVEIIGMAALVGPWLGLIALILVGVLLRSSGRWLGGHGGSGAVRAALAWAGAPLIAGILLWLVQLILLPQASFSSLPVAPLPALLALLCGALHVGLALWSAWLSLVGLATAHGFSVLRAAWSWLLAGLFIAVIALAVGFGTATLIGLRGG
jgi:hypothetical protein